jgi:hypothetical protein
MGHIRRAGFLTLAMLVAIVGIGRVIFGHGRARRVGSMGAATTDTVAPHPVVRPSNGADSHSEKRSPLGVLSHPLLTLVVGAVLTSLLIPSLTRQWQDHQKELEVKTTMVTDINEATALVLGKAMAFGTGRYAGEESETDLQFEYNKGYQEWSVQSAEIYGRLRAFLGGDIPTDTNDPVHDIPAAWRRLERMVFGFYELMIADSAERRVAPIDALMSELGTMGVGNIIFAFKEMIVEEILSSDLKGFDTETPKEKIEDFVDYLIDRLP